MRKSASDKSMLTVAYVFLGVFALICLWPLLLVLGVSFSDETEVAWYGYRVIPMTFSTSTYEYVWVNSGDNILNAYGVTIIITVLGTALAMFTTCTMAFSISQPSVKYRNVVAFLCTFTTIFSAGLIPWYIVCVNYYHLSNTFFALFLPNCFATYNMFLMRNYFTAIPLEIYESATIDGASNFRIFWQMAIPLSVTPLLTVGMMYALGFWNDWYLALMFITKKQFYPLQFYLYTILANVNAISSGRVPQNALGHIKLPTETVKMAITVIAIGPILLLYPMVQKYFIRGVMTGAVKG